MGENNIFSLEAYPVVSASRRFPRGEVDSF